MTRDLQLIHDASLSSGGGSQIIWNRGGNPVRASKRRKPSSSFCAECMRVAMLCLILCICIGWQQRLMRMSLNWAERYRLHPAPAINCLYFMNKLGEAACLTCPFTYRYKHSHQHCVHSAGYSLPTASVSNGQVCSVAVRWPKSAYPTSVLLRLLSVVGVDGGIIGQALRQQRDKTGQIKSHMDCAH